MARIGDGLLKNWLDGSVVKATEYKQEREILRTAINDNDARIGTNTTDLTNVTDRVEVLETDNTENKSDIASLEGRMTAAEGVNSTQEVDISSLQSRITNAESTNTDQSMEIDALQTRVTVTENKNTEQDTRLASVESVNTSQTNEISAIGTRVSSLEGTSATNSGRISSVESGVSDLTTRMTSAESKNTEQDNRINNIVGNVGVSNTEIVDARLGADGTTHTVLKNRLDRMENNLIDKDRISQTLLHGVSIFSSALNSPVELEIQGRTLISLGNSNLEGNKNYVLTDKRTKVRAEGREGTQISGVGKFVKSASVLTKADFAGKVAGDLNVNPHKATFSVSSTSLILPNTGAEFGTYVNFQTLNGVSGATGGALGAGRYDQHLFSFNIIEQIERKQGRIPSDTVAGKVQWIKDNVNKIIANHHGWASSVGGNGLSFVIWTVNTSSWSASSTHANGTVTKVSNGMTGNVTNYVDSNGFAHFLAHTTTPSDGTTPSQLNTDFVECEVELKTTAVLDTRPILTRVANFEGKVSASTVENPHLAKWSQTTALPNPNSGAEFVQDAYNRVNALNATSYTITNTGSGYYSSQTFSFDLIQEIERNIGRIPKSTLAEKVQWVKDNVTSGAGASPIIFNWYGFGSSVGGNKANVRVWNATNSSWLDGILSHTSGTVSQIQFILSVNASPYIDSNGMVSFLCYAEASDGVVASTINTDYCDVWMNLKQGATLFDPITPLYEVDSTEYGNILTTWDETNVLNRYPRVQGVQHLQNVAVVAEGENLLPPFSEWTLHANASVKSPYELVLNATATAQKTVSPYINVLPNTTYFVSGVGTGLVLDVEYYTKTGTYLTFLLGSGNRSFITPSNCEMVLVKVSGNASGTFNFSNTMLNLGNTAKPFVPRNPSYLFAPVKLGQIGDKKDSLFSQDGQWVVRKQVEKDVVLDGSLAWLHYSDSVGFKKARYLNFSSNNLGRVITKYNGSIVANNQSSSLADQNEWWSDAVYITVSDTDSGFGESYTPTSDDLKRYFNGWKYTDGTTWQSVTGNGQTATASVALSTKPTDYTPYKLSYVLATPQLVNVNNIVEGAINASGQIEVTSGVVVREKVVPVSGGAMYYLGNTTAPLKNKNSRILAVYKNGILDKGWNIRTSGTAFGLYLAEIPQAQFDTTAVYEVTYLVLDRHLQTNNATEVKASYSGSLKDTVDMTTEQLTDLKTQTSINSSLLYRLLVQAKANGWSV